MMLSAHLKSWLEKLRSDIPLPQVAMWKDKSLLDTWFEPGHPDTLSHGTWQQGLFFLENLG
jgi:hypothetical protein